MEDRCCHGMEDPPQEAIVSIVRSVFDVSEFTKTEFSLEFEIADLEFKSKFEYLARRLEGLSYICRLERVDGSIFVIVQKFARGKQGWLFRSSWIPRILFAVVVTFVMIDGYFRTATANTIINIGNPLEMAAIYTMSLLGILGIHELGHIVAARMHKLGTTWPYFIPGIPVMAIPTFGAFIRSRGLTINREILFDVAIAGPIAGLVIAVIVSMYGAYTAPVLDQETAAVLFADSRLTEWSMGEPLLMTASLAMFGKGIGNEVIMTPVLFAAWIGLLITFLNLLPAWQLDGGHMARTLLAPNLHRYATYGSIAVLALLGFWVMALLILFMSMRTPSAAPLDNVTPLPRNRKFAYAGIVVLAVLCAPLPAEFGLLL